MVCKSKTTLFLNYGIYLLNSRNTEKRSEVTTEMPARKDENKKGPE